MSNYKIEKPIEIGDKIGYLTVLKEANHDDYKLGNHNKVWLCECNSPYHNNPVQCIAKDVDLRSGHKVSCGCVKKNNTNNNIYKSSHGIYNSLRQMMSRCYDPDYINYGGRGIRICREWYNPENHNDVECLRNFWNWSMLNGWKHGLTIERIDSNGNYEPSNCTWANDVAQNNNRYIAKTVIFNNEEITIGNLAYILGLDYDIIYQRLSHNNFDLNSITTWIDTPYGPLPHLLDRQGNYIPVNCIYFKDRYGYYIPQDQYQEAFKYALWLEDSKGFIVRPIMTEEDFIYNDPIKYIEENKELSPGDTFGEITIIERIDNKWYKSGSKIQYRCRCKNGHIFNKLRSDIISGSTTCPMCHHIQPGQTYGKYKVIEIDKDNPYIRNNGKKEPRYKVEYIKKGKIVTGSVRVSELRKSEKKIKK